VKVESWLFSAGAFFFFPLCAVYTIVTDWTEPVGSVALLLTGGLSIMIGWYLWFTSRHIDERPEDDPAARVEDSAGEYGFFSPYSWWPLPLAGSAAIAFLGLAIGWWLVLLGGALGALALVGWVFEYWRGAHAH
jgi:hypothetical protein